MLSIIVCDDEPSFHETIRQYLSQYFRSDRYRLYSFFSGRELEEERERGLQADIAFLDIQIGEDNGIELAGKLFPAEEGTQVIFVTGYIEYCSSVYEADHAYFLLKPLEFQSFQNAMARAIERRREYPEKYLNIRTRRAVYHIPASEILYLESKARKVLIRCREEDVECYARLGAIMEQLHKGFVQCHKSFCVNMDYVQKLEQDRFILQNGETVPISQNRRAVTRQRFLQYIGESI